MYLKDSISLVDSQDWSGLPDAQIQADLSAWHTSTSDFVGSVMLQLGFCIQ